MEWRAGEPGNLDFKMIVREPYLVTQVLANISTLSGSYIGTIHSGRSQLSLSPMGRTGEFHVKITIAPMVLAEGDYAIDFQVHGYNPDDQFTVAWQSMQPRIISIRGDEPAGSIIKFNAAWSSGEVDESSRDQSNNEIVSLSN